MTCLSAVYLWNFSHFMCRHDILASWQLLDVRQRISSLSNVTSFIATKRIPDTGSKEGKSEKILIVCHIFITVINQLEDLLFLRFHGKCTELSANGRKIADNVWQVDCKYESVSLVKVYQGRNLGLNFFNHSIYPNSRSINNQRCDQAPVPKSYKHLVMSEGFNRMNWTACPD